MDTKKSKLELIAERLWYNDFFQIQLKEMRADCKKNDSFATPEGHLVLELRQKMEQKGFSLSPIWNQLLARAINDADCPFIAFAHHLLSITWVSKRWGSDNEPSLNIHPESTDRDINTALKSLRIQQKEDAKDNNKGTVRLEKPWKYLDWAVECNGMRKKNFKYREIAQIMNDKYKAFIFDEDTIKGWVRKLNIRSQNK